MRRRIFCRMALLFLLLVLPACGKEEQAVLEKYYGIDVMQKEEHIVRPAQAVCTQDGAWVVSLEKYGGIYHIVKDTGETERIEWERTEGEYLIHVSESKGSLYAAVHNREEDTIQIRKHLGEGAWNVSAVIAMEEEAWSSRKSCFFVDRKENFYLSGEDSVTYFSSDGEQLCRYELPGSPCSIEMDDNNILLCLVLSKQGIILYEFDGTEAKEKWTYPGAFSQVFLMENSDTSVLFAVVDGAVIVFDRESGELLEKSDLSQAGVPLSGLYAGSMDTKEGMMRLYGSYGSGEEDYLICYLMREQAEGEEKQRVNLIYGTTEQTLNIDSNMKERIAAFNRTNQDYYVTTKVYEGEEGMTQMMADIISGNGPDIIELYNLFEGLSYMDLVNKGCLTDLTGYLEQTEYKDDIFWNVLESDRVNGKLYRITPHFYITGMAISPEYEDSFEEWNIEAFLKILEMNDGEKSIFGYSSRLPESLLSYLFHSMQSEFIDWEQKKADFESGEFISLLEICKRYGGAAANSEDDMGYLDLRAANALFLEMSISDILYYTTAVGYYGREYQIYGYPVAEGQRYNCYPFCDACGINSQSKNKDGAWAFIETLLDTDYQKKDRISGLPLRISCWEETCENKKKVGNQANSKQEAIYITDNEIAILENILYNGEFDKKLLNDEILNVVKEEAAYYFADEKSAEETAHVIQSRVEIILQE